MTRGIVHIEAVVVVVAVAVFVVVDAVVIVAVVEVAAGLVDDKPMFFSMKYTSMWLGELLTAVSGSDP